MGNSSVIREASNEMQLQSAFIMIGERLDPLNHSGEAIIVEIAIDLGQTQRSTAWKNNREIFHQNFHF